MYYIQYFISYKNKNFKLYNITTIYKSITISELNPYYL